VVKAFLSIKPPFSLKLAQKRASSEAYSMNASVRIFRRAGYFLMVMWLGFGSFLLALLFADALLGLLFKDAKTLRVHAGTPAIAREAMPANGTERGYWQEHDAAKEVQWQPYVYFRRKPYQGKLIHVDAHGFRATVNPPGAVTAVWVFGGSTVWGTGVSDANTVASALARAGALHVANFGETGYVSAQSQLAFMAALRCPEAAKPAVAVFIDGVNDVYSALQAGRAGWPQNESNRSAEFNSSRDASAIAQVLSQRLQGLQRAREHWTHAITSEAIPEVATLAPMIARNYLAVVAQTRAFAVDQGVTPLFIWQPSVFERKQPSADEQSVIDNSLQRHFDLQRASTAALKRLLSAEPANDVLVLDDLFDADAEPVYLDYAHTGVRGNSILAERIWMQINSELSIDTPINAAAQWPQSCPDRPVQ
jgi:hypothetical protein